jgi:hypothetical protein
MTRLELLLSGAENSMKDLRIFNCVILAKNDLRGDTKEYDKESDADRR